jgi:hypothetical protein
MRTSAPRARAASSFVQFRVKFEAPQRVAPHAFEHVPRGSQGFAAGSVETAASVGANGHQARLAQCAQLQRDGAECDVGHRGMNGAGPKLLVPHEPKNLPAAGRRDGREDGCFGWHIYNLD